MTKEIWIKSITEGINTLANPIEGFSKYQFNQLYSNYDDFLDYAVTYLYDEADLSGFIDGHLGTFGVDKMTTDKLQVFDIYLSKFYESTRGLSDFELIRHQEWDKLVVLAKDCSISLSQV